MGFYGRLKISTFSGDRSRVGSALALALLLATLVALYPVPFANALKTVPTEINYDDPNMAATEGYVAEASISCIKQGGTGSDVHSCMRGFSKPSSQTSEDSEPVSVAQKKDEVETPSPLNSEKDSK